VSPDLIHNTGGCRFEGGDPAVQQEEPNHSDEAEAMGGEAPGPERPLLADNGGTLHVTAFKLNR